MVDDSIQCNVNLTRDDTKALEAMMTLTGYENRSAFVRWLIRQEYARRFSRPNPGVTIAQAQAAAEEVTK